MSYAFVSRPTCRVLGMILLLLSVVMPGLAQQSGGKPAEKSKTVSSEGRAADLWSPDILDR